MIPSKSDISEILKILLATSLWDRLYLLALALIVSVPLTAWLKR